MGTTRDYDRETPVSDEVFAAYGSLYAHDRAPLNARVERTDDSAPHWRHEEVIRETLDWFDRYLGPV